MILIYSYSQANDTIRRSVIASFVGTKDFAYLMLFGFVGCGIGFLIASAIWACFCCCCCCKPKCGSGGEMHENDVELTAVKHVEEENKDSLSKILEEKAQLLEARENEVKLMREKVSSFLENIADKAETKSEPANLPPPPPELLQPIEPAPKSI